jgi:hypothetical protein
VCEDTHSDPVCFFPGNCPLSGTLELAVIGSDSMTASLFMRTTSGPISVVGPNSESWEMNEDPIFFQLDKIEAELNLAM